MLQVKAGDIKKMGLLFERYHRELFRFLYHTSGQIETSEDLTQTVFYRMLKYRHTFTGEGSFRTWMYHLARNVLNDSIKKDKYLISQKDVATYATLSNGDFTADGELYREEEVKLLYNALNRLSNEHREVLILSRLQELKYNEIARILDITEGTLKVRIHRAMKELRKHYQQLER